MIRWVAVALIVLGSTALAGELALPNPNLTPGVATLMTADALCAKTYRTRDARSVSTSDKRERFEAYGIKCRPIFGKDKKLPRCGAWEIDHLVSLELAGSNERLNLWPQPMKEARLKDKLENRLHKEVCAGNMTLDQAQEAIRVDWRIPFETFFGEPQ